MVSSSVGATLIIRQKVPRVLMVNHSTASFLRIKQGKKESVSLNTFIDASKAKETNEQRRVHLLFMRLQRRNMLI